MPPSPDAQSLRLRRPTAVDKSVTDNDEATVPRVSELKDHAGKEVVIDGVIYDLTARGGPRPAAEEATDTPQDERPSEVAPFSWDSHLHPGDFVEVHGLQVAQEWNGSIAKLDYYQAKRNRWRVVFKTGESYFVDIPNLKAFEGGVVVAGDLAPGDRATLHGLRIQKKHNGSIVTILYRKNDKGIDPRWLVKFDDGTEKAVISANLRALAGGVTVSVTPTKVGELTVGVVTTLANESQPCHFCLHRASFPNMECVCAPGADFYGRREPSTEDRAEAQGATKTSNRNDARGYQVVTLANSSNLNDKIQATCDRNFPGVLVWTDGDIWFKVELEDRSGGLNLKHDKTVWTLDDVASSALAVPDEPTPVPDEPKPVPDEPTPVPDEPTPAAASLSLIETQEKKADDLFYAYYHSDVHTPTKNAAMLAPYQMLLTYIASPDIAAANHNERPCHQLFATSTGSGKTLTILNSVWQYATYEPTSGKAFDCYIIAPKAAIGAIVSELKRNQSISAITGLHRFVTDIINLNKQAKSGASKSKNDEKKANEADDADEEDGEEDEDELGKLLKRELRRRRIHFLPFHRFVKYIGDKPPESPDAELKELLKLRHVPHESKEKKQKRLAAVSRLALFFDEAHGLVDPSMTTEPGTNAVTNLPKVREALYRTNVGCCFFFTWTFMTKSAANAVALMATLRGLQWATDKNISLQDRNPDIIAFSTTHKHNFFFDDIPKSNSLRRYLKQFKTLKCPGEPIDHISKYALAMSPIQQRLFYEMCRHHVFYLDVSTHTRTLAETNTTTNASNILEEPQRKTKAPLRDTYVEQLDTLRNGDSREYVRLLLAENQVPCSKDERNAWYVKHVKTEKGLVGIRKVYNELCDYVNYTASRKKSDESQETQPIDFWKESYVPGGGEKLTRIIQRAEEMHTKSDNDADISDGKLRLKVAELLSRKPYTLPSSSMAYASREYKLLRPKDFMKRLLDHYNLDGVYETPEQQATFVDTFCNLHRTHGLLLSGFAANLKGDFTFPYKYNGSLTCEGVAEEAMKIYKLGDHHIANENDHELARIIEANKEATPGKYSGSHTSRPYYAWQEDLRLEESLRISKGDQSKAKARLADWANVSGRFSNIYPKAIKYLSVSDALHDRLHKAQSSSTDDVRFALFPFWDGVRGVVGQGKLKTQLLTEDNHCKQDIDIDLFTSYEAKVGKMSLDLNQASTAILERINTKSKDCTNLTEYNLAIPESIDSKIPGRTPEILLLTKTLKCRAPKLFELVSTMETPLTTQDNALIRDTQNRLVKRNAVLYLPFKNRTCSITLTTMLHNIKNIIAVSLDLNVYDSKLKASSPPVDGTRGYVFALLDPGTKENEKENEKVLARFGALATQDRRNVLILTRDHFQSTDVKGANCIFRFQPFTKGRSSQIVGRVHRTNAQSDESYPTLQTIEDNRIYFKSDETKNDAFLCDGVIDEVYTILKEPEDIIIRIIKQASFGRSAMRNLNEGGLKFLPSSLSYEEYEEYMKHKPALLIEPTQPGGEVGDAQPQAPPMPPPSVRPQTEAPRGSRDPAPAKKRERTV